MYVADRASQDGWFCWPSQQTIARETELSERTVRRALCDLEDAGLIRRKHRYDRRGKRTSDMITLVGFDRDSGSTTGHGGTPLPVTAAGKPSREPSTVSTRSVTSRHSCPTHCISSSRYAPPDHDDGELTAHDDLGLMSVEAFFGLE